ncbi:MAG: hypothetical protein Q4G68_06200 [Planctomycetia bacterium]|nr:hypothetical protein [Planctomycetia bacterium]
MKIMACDIPLSTSWSIAGFAHIFKKVKFLIMKHAAMIIVTGLITLLSSAYMPGAELQKEDKAVVSAEIMEVTPVVWENKPLLFCSKRPFVSDHTPQSLGLRIMDLTTGEFVSDFGQCHSLGCAIIADGCFHVYAARQESVDSWFLDIDHFSSSDLVNWKMEPAIIREGGEHLLNSSVCQDDQGYIMAYESDQPVGFCFKFARSNDLSHWTKIPNIAFAGPDQKSYSACPVIRYFAPWYYVIYLRADNGTYVSDLVRSKDLITWEASPNNPVLKATPEEGINNSDVDLFQWQGETILFYATGNQQTWTDVRKAVYPGPMKEFFESYYPTDTPAPTFKAISP